MGTTTTCRRLKLSTAARPPSPNFMRSQSGAPEISAAASTTADTTKRFIARSQSTTTSRTASSNNRKTEEIIKPSRKSFSTSRESVNKDALARFLNNRHRYGSGSPRNSYPSRGVKSATTSPSAWALSPGRMTSSRACMMPPESPVRGGGGGGGVHGVLKYFKNREKKVSPIQEEGYHRFRVLYNRLIQWRLVNARAEAAMDNSKVRAEDQLFRVWLRIHKMRNYALEKLIQTQKLRLEMKLHQIMRHEMPLLNDWAKMDAKNYEALSRVTRKLHALSIRVPLSQGAKTDVMSIYEAMKEAIEVLDSIEATITNFFSEVEKILYLLTELTSMFEQEVECFEEVEKSIALVPILLSRENSLRVHLIQAREMK